MNNHIAQVKISPAREAIADALRNALLSGAFSPGENLSDVDLAARLGVSRGPIREALLMLSMEGLVTHSQNRGFSAMEITDHDVIQIAQVRLPFEALALTWARKQVSAENLSRLRHLKDAILQATSSGGVRKAAQPELEFHALIAEMSGNLWLEIALRRVLVPFFAFASAYGVLDKTDAVPRLQVRHEMYLDYLEGKTARSAEECVRFHLERYSAALE